jgi:hypothetical protein
MSVSTQYSSGTKGGDADYKTQDARGLREERGIVVGVVKSNAHPGYMGVLQVFVPTFADKSTEVRENDDVQWRSVRYATPFYTRTENQGSGNHPVTVKNTGGITYPCPDIGSTVLCFFPEGRNQDGYWFACAPDLHMMQTIPESGMTSNFDKTGLENLVRYDKAPGIEFNDKDNDVEKLTNPKKPRRGVDRNKAIQLKTAGIDQDEVRGLTTSHAMRESPSELFGISTKGRRLDHNNTDIAHRKDIIEALNTGKELKSKKDAEAVEGRMGRKHGHAFVMDDGDIEGNNNLVRLRTAGGHQILMHDTENIVYIGNNTGTTWIQMDANGQLDVFSQTSMNFRSRSMNFHADSTMKFNAGAQIQMVSGGSITLEGKKLANLYSDGQVMMYGGKGGHLKSGASLNMQGGSTVGIKAGGKMDLQASCIALNGAAPGAKKQNSVSMKSLDDTKPDGKGFWSKNAGGLKTTVDRAPTHEPYPYHKNVTQETIFNTIDVGDVPSSGSLSVKKPKLPILSANAGLDVAKSLPGNGFKATNYEQLVGNLGSRFASSGFVAATPDLNEFEAEFEFIGEA